MNALTAGAAPETKPSTQAALATLDNTPPELAKLAKQVNSLMPVAEAYVIDSPEMYQAAAADLVAWRTDLRDLEKQRTWLKAPFLEGGRRIDAMFDLPKTALENAGKLLSSKMGVYKAEQDRIAEEARLAEENRLRKEREALLQQQREADDRARAAREKADREAREARERADREAQEARDLAERKAADARRAGDEEAARRAEQQAADDARVARERAEREAADAEASAAAEQQAAAAQAAEVQAQMDIADVAPTQAVAASAAVANGVSTRTTFEVKSVDKAALVKAAAAALAEGNDTLLAYLVVDEKALNGIARALKGAARVPGVTFGTKTSFAATGRR